MKWIKQNYENVPNSEVSNMLVYAILIDMLIYAVIFFAIDCIYMTSHDHRKRSPPSAEVNPQITVICISLIVCPLK